MYKFYFYNGGLISLWLYKENNKLRDWKNYLLYIFPLRSTHIWPLCSNLFSPSKKNYFGCAANRKSQKLISTPKYLNSIKRLVFVLGTKYVFCGVGSESLNSGYMDLKGEPWILSSLFLSDLWTELSGQGWQWGLFPAPRAITTAIYAGTSSRACLRCDSFLLVFWVTLSGAFLLLWSTSEEEPCPPPPQSRRRWEFEMLQPSVLLGVRSS
jgi:hypothetical protein